MNKTVNTLIITLVIALGSVSPSLSQGIPPPDYDRYPARSRYIGDFNGLGEVDWYYDYYTYDRMDDIVPDEDPRSDFYPDGMYYGPRVRYADPYAFDYEDAVGDYNLPNRQYYPYYNGRYRNESDDRWFYDDYDYEGYPTDYYEGFTNYPDYYDDYTEIYNDPYDIGD